MKQKQRSPMQKNGVTTTQEHRNDVVVDKRKRRSINDDEIRAVLSSGPR